MYIKKSRVSIPDAVEEACERESDDCRESRGVGSQSGHGRKDTLDELQSAVGVIDVRAPVQC